MRVFRLSLVVALALGCLTLEAARQSAGTRYFPPAGTWEARTPEQLGLDQAKLDAAVTAAIATEARSDKDLAIATPQQFRSEAPYNNLLGPTQVRAGASVLVIYKGNVVARSGDVDRADMTFSVTKTFLSTVVGEAVERGLIKNLDDKVGPYMPAGVDLFTSEHNAKITWDHLLRQTSDWSGTLWGKPDWADRPQNCLGPGVPVPSIEACKDRPLKEPGTAYKYNDTRVNVLALATLYLFKEPLPSVLKREIMDPIGASSTWHWEPYENAYVTIDGKRMPSIPGGGHHGGGMFISAWDMARFGYLFLNKGSWNGKQLVTEAWIAKARTPGVNQSYGFMNWMLNANRPNRVSFEGNGPNVIYVDWDNDLVIVTRWLQGHRAFADAVAASIKP